MGLLASLALVTERRWFRAISEPSRKWFGEVTLEGARKVAEAGGEKTWTVGALVTVLAGISSGYFNENKPKEYLHFPAHFRIFFTKSDLQPVAGACIPNIKPKHKFQIYTSKTMQGFPEIAITLKISIPDWQSTVTAFSSPWSWEFIKLVSVISSIRSWCFWYKRINVCKIVWGSSRYKGSCGTAIGKIVKTQSESPGLKCFILHTNLFTKILNLDVLEICWPLDVTNWFRSSYLLKAIDRILQRRQWHPTPVLLVGKSHGRRSLVCCSPWGCEELDMTKQLHFHFSLSCTGEGNGNTLQCSCLENPRDGVAQSGQDWSDLAAVALIGFKLKVESKTL